jgi:hypothetical protein
MCVGFLSLHDLLPSITLSFGLALRHGLGFAFAPPISFGFGCDDDAAANFHLARALTEALQVLAISAGSATTMVAVATATTARTPKVGLSAKGNF